jgi:hypothetical protein
MGKVMVAIARNAGKLINLLQGLGSMAKMEFPVLSDY